MWEGVEVNHFKDVNIDNDSGVRLSHIHPYWLKPYFANEQQTRKLFSPPSLDILLQISQYK